MEVKARRQLRPPERIPVKAISWPVQHTSECARWRSSFLFCCLASRTDVSRSFTKLLAGEYSRYSTSNAYFGTRFRTGGLRGTRTLKPLKQALEWARQGVAHWQCFLPGEVSQWECTRRHRSPDSSLEHRRCPFRCADRCKCVTRIFLGAEQSVTFSLLGLINPSARKTFLVAGVLPARRE